MDSYYSLSKKILFLTKTCKQDWKLIYTCSISKSFFFSFKETVYLLADTLLIFLFIEIHISGFYIIGYQCHANYHDSSFSSKRKDSFSMKYLFCVEIIEIFVAINLIILRGFFFSFNVSNVMRTKELKFSVWLHKA